jgi:hypothetical protein
MCIVHGYVVPEAVDRWQQQGYAIYPHNFNENPAWYQAVRIAEEACAEVFAAIAHGWGLLIAAA